MLLFIAMLWKVPVLITFRVFRSCSKAAAGKMSLYESFAQATALGDLHTCLMMDMKACQEDDVRLLCYLTPSIYSEVCIYEGIGSATYGRDNNLFV